MHILITGADGFIGSALAQALLARGHRLTLAVRGTQRAAKQFPGQRVLAVDFATDHAPATWRPRLDGVDAVVNTVGIFRETGAQTFEAIHVRAPIALFEACIEAGVRRVVQISALGAARDAPTAFLRSKHAADTALSALPLSSVVVRPSLVFAPQGTSARLFLQLAALPLVPLPAGGGQCVQPIHRDDLVAALDLALGIATLVMRRRQWLYAFQALVILGYTAIITLWLPEYWLHPYGPVLKNLPLLAALWLLHALDREENTREGRR
jgi:uncharacterized protein YbjT (DUF2867 family)